MAQRREEFERLIAQTIAHQSREMKACFRQIDESMAADRFVDTVVALERFSATLGKELKLSKFSDFDQAMKKGKPLVL
ncbi:hypothetical protein ACQKK5_00520 [Brevibacillus panacihumi]|uniref:hypothetical protein n=1 Tax=Brevibacillus panacihumi TaxID=497735 RepID=UPI003D092C5B